jgi:hypothetical protein
MTAGYPFRNEATGEVCYLDFEKMMQADCMGVIIEDGEVLRRARDLEPRASKRVDRTKERPEIISDALGFPGHQLKEMEADRKQGKFSNVEFREDPTCPEFFQVKCSSPSAFQKYMKHRGFFDKSSVNGGAVFVDIDAARRLVSRGKTRAI